MSARITLTKVVGPACVQDLGRPGQLALGLPRGGALAPRRLRALNASIGNAPGDAALEVFGLVEFSVSAPVAVAIDDNEPFVARAGETYRVATEGRRVRLIAFAGGVAVPEVLGGRGLLPSARMGGHEGRWLRSGDTLPLPGAHTTLARVDTPHDPMPRAPLESLRVELWPGPEHGSLVDRDVLEACAFRVAATSDRTGLHLEGDTVRLHPRPHGTSSLPLVPGAVQLPPSGQPVVLGPDHPVTGGYPVVGVVQAGSLEALFVAPLGSTLRFVRPSLS